MQPASAAAAKLEMNGHVQTLLAGRVSSLIAVYMEVFVSKYATKSVCERTRYLTRWKGRGRRKLRDDARTLILGSKYLRSLELLRC